MARHGRPPVSARNRPSVNRPTHAPNVGGAKGRLAEGPGRGGNNLSGNIRNTLNSGGNINGNRAFMNSGGNIAAKDSGNVTLNNSGDVKVSGNGNGYFGRGYYGRGGHGEETISAETMAAETMVVDTIAAEPTSWADMRPAWPRVLRSPRAETEGHILLTGISLDPLRVPLA